MSKKNDAIYKSHNRHKATTMDDQITKSNAKKQRPGKKKLFARAATPTRLVLVPQENCEFEKPQFADRDNNITG